MDTFNQQRKDSLSDIVADYLSDESTSGLTFYNDIKDEIKSWKDYHTKNLEKCNTILNLIDHTNVNLEDSCMPPWGHSDLEYLIANPKSSNQYTEEELNAMCDKAASDQDKDVCREYNLREAEYYNKQDPAEYGSWEDK
jgi:hypothetical protein